MYKWLKECLIKRFKFKFKQFFLIIIEKNTMYVDC